MQHGHGHGHGRTHTYITGDVSTGHGHGGEHAYVTSAPEKLGEKYQEALGRIRSHAGRGLDSLSFEHRDHSRYGMGILVAHHPEMPDNSRFKNYAGHIAWLTDSGEVAGIEVHPDLQRRGVATELWHRAKELVPHLKHSDNQTDEGKAWARTTASARRYVHISPDPSARLFGPTYGLDHRLFDESGQLKTDVRTYILETLGNWWKPTYGVSWDEWAKVYFAGSEASEWTSETLEGNGDFDVLIGVDYDKFRANGCKCHDADKTNAEITDELNASLRKLDEKTATVWIPVKSQEWHHQAAFNQNKLQMSSGGTRRAVQPQDSHLSMESAATRSVGISNSLESLGITAGVKRRASSEGSSAPSVVVPETSRQSPGVAPASPGISGIDTSASTTASRPSSSMSSSSNRAAAVPFVDGPTSSSLPTMITGVAPAGGRVGSASGEFSAPGVIKDSPTLVKPIFMPQSVMWTAESPPLAPEGWEYIGPFNGTFYVNPDSWDIRKIRPYAAYNVSDDVWAVKPPHLPDWDISKFPEGQALVEEARAVASYVQAILKLPEPYRTQQGYALWQHLHSDRGRAFTGQGEGWYDPANVIEKWLDQQGLWEKLVEIMLKVKSDPAARDAPADWSNDPHSSV